MTDIQDKILSLAQASKLTGYHQDYLGYLCRTGKLTGQKIGRNWITTAGAVKQLMGETFEEVPQKAKIPISVVPNSQSPAHLSAVRETPSVLSLASIEVKGLPIRLRAISTGSSKSLVSHSDIAIVSKTISSLRLQVASLMDQVKMLTASLAGQQVATSNVFASQLYKEPQKFLSALPFTSHRSANEHTPSFSVLGSIDDRKVIKSFSSPRSANPIVIILASLLIAIAGSAFLVKGNLFGTNTTLYSLYISNDKNNTVATETDPSKTQVAFATNKNEEGKVLGITTQAQNRTAPAEFSEEYINDLVMQNLVVAESLGFFKGGTSKRVFTNIVNKPVPSLESSSIDSLTAGTLAVNGNATVTGNLEVTGTFTGNITGAGTAIGAEITGATEGSVLFADGSEEIAQDNANFFWDDTRNSLGVGTSEPTAKLSVNGSSGFGTGNITASSGTGVTGTGTAFLTELKVGDQITVNGQSRIVASIASNTSLTTTVAFSPVITTTPNVDYVNTATDNTGSVEANTLSWDHVVDETVENGLLTVSIAVHKNAALAIPTISSVTYGGHVMTLQTATLADANTRIEVWKLLAPPTGTNEVLVTLSATARVIAQSILFANVNQSSAVVGTSSGGGTNTAIAGSAFGATTRQALLVSASHNANITAAIELDPPCVTFTELINAGSGSTADDPRLLVAFQRGTGGLNFVCYELSGSTPNIQRSITINNAATATGAYTHRSNLLSVVDSGDYEQILFSADGSASFHNGISVDLSGGSNTYSALFNGGYVGIGTTTPTNELSVTGDADFSGSIGVAGGTVDPNVGINIVSEAAYGGDSVVRYGVYADLTATDNSHVYAGRFIANSSTSGGLPDHPILIGVTAESYHLGTGRIDAAEGFAGVVQNASSGWINDAYGSFNQIANLDAGYINRSYGVFSDTINLSDDTAITSANAFYGKIRTLGGTAGFGTVAGLNLSSWDTTGAAVTTSYGIFMDTSIDIGTTRYALYSSSTSDSYFQGDVGIGTASPDSKLHIGSADLGNGAAGPVVTLGRNNNGTNTGAGSINFQSKAGVAGYVWQDNAGNIRVHTAAPTHANDTAGTVVGDQTSTRETKQDFADYTNYQDALQMVVAAPLHTFRYKKDVSGYGENSPLAKTRIGYIADEVPGEFMWGNSIDQVSVNGILMASVKALNDEITSLKVQSNNATSNTTIVPEHFHISEDNIGQAQIIAGETSVRVSFMSFYESQPVVVATPTEFVGGSYRVTGIDDSGFTIELETEQSIDIFFNWHSFASDKTKLTVSDGSSKLVELVIHQPNTIVIEEPILPEATEIVETSEPPVIQSEEDGEVAGDQTDESTSEPESGPNQN